MRCNTLRKYVNNSPRLKKKLYELLVYMMFSNDSEYIGPMYKHTQDDTFSVHILECNCSVCMVSFAAVFDNGNVRFVASTWRQHCS